MLCTRQDIGRKILGWQKVKLFRFCAMQSDQGDAGLATVALRYLCFEIDPK